MTSTISGPWPIERSSEAGVTLQFGRSRAELVRWALMTGDPLADAAIAEAMENKAAHVALTEGVKHGLHSLANPPSAIAEFLSAVENFPAYVGDTVFDQDSRPFFSMASPVHIVSLSAGALIRVYESPSIAQVLVSTGRLVDGANSRIRETGKWVVLAMLPGNMRVGMPGYVATLQVRLLHARMRVLARKRGFDETTYGAPINQIDLARTWIDFTRTSLLAEQEMGFALNSHETAQVYRYWWLVAHVLGIDARLVHGISSHEQAARLDELVQAVTGPLNAQSGELASHTLQSVAGTLNNVLHLPKTIGSRALGVLARRFHGDDVADELGIVSDGAVDAILGAAIGAVRGHRDRARRNPEAWEKTIDANIAAARKAIDGFGTAQYEA